MREGADRAKMWLVCFVLLTAGAHAAALREVRAADLRAAALTLQGDYSVVAPPSPGAVGLSLKSGFSVLLRGSAARTEPVVLRIAKQRVGAAEIAASFVPIGPTVDLSALTGRADVALRAHAFRVRSGQRLVLAVEQPGCRGAGPAGCRSWRLFAASHVAGRCVARGVQPGGLRLQFGSISPPLSDREAPQSLSGSGAR